MRVAILGCGYVGLELGRQLEEAGHEPIGVRRSAAGIDAIESAGFRGIRADVTDAASLDAVPDVGALVFAASSGGRGADAAREIYVGGLETAIEAFGARESPPGRLIYTSSTGVYGDHGGDWVDEDTPLDPGTEKTRVLAEAERIALEEASVAGIEGTVARFAGLYGPDRYRLKRYLEAPVTAGYLNMIHRDDAAGAVRFLLDRDLARGEVVLVVDDEPIDKHAFADWLAAAAGRDPPPKQSIEARLDGADLSATARDRIRAQKRCSNAKLRELGYEFACPTFREGYREAIGVHRDGP
jgi:nucleoside-diphosphate-sugar epimerase